MKLVMKLFLFQPKKEKENLVENLLSLDFPFVNVVYLLYIIEIFYLIFLQKHNPYKLGKDL